MMKRTTMAGSADRRKPTRRLSFQLYEPSHSLVNADSSDTSSAPNATRLSLSPSLASGSDDDDIDPTHQATEAKLSETDDEVVVSQTAIHIEATAHDLQAGPSEKTQAEEKNSACVEQVKHTESESHFEVVNMQATPRREPSVDSSVSVEEVVVVEKQQTSKPAASSQQLTKKLALTSAAPVVPVPSQKLRQSRSREKDAGIVVVRVKSPRHKSPVRDRHYEQREPKHRHTRRDVSRPRRHTMSPPRRRRHHHHKRAPTPTPSSILDSQSLSQSDSLDHSDNDPRPTHRDPRHRRHANPHSDSDRDNELSRNSARSENTSDEDESGARIQRKRRIRHSLFKMAEFRIGDAMDQVKRLYTYGWWLLVLCSGNAGWMTWARVLRANSTGIEGMVVVNWLNVLVGFAMAVLSRRRTADILKNYRSIHRSHVKDAQTAPDPIVLQRLVLFTTPFQKFYAFTRKMLMYQYFNVLVCVVSAFSAGIGIFETTRSLNDHHKADFAMIMTFSGILSILGTYLFYRMLQFDISSVVTVLHDARTDHEQDVKVNMEQPVQVVVLPVDPTVPSPAADTTAVAAQQLAPSSDEDYDESVASVAVAAASKA